MSYTNGLDKPSNYFSTKLYTGNDADDRSITGVTFQPDWTLIKCRTAVKPTNVFDSVRGATKRIFTGGTDAEGTATSTLKSFNSNGFVVGTHNNVNANSETYVSWNWLASNTTASNTDGSITSTVSANTTSGFSIVSYTGTGSNATVGHGLGSAPSMIIVKNRDSVKDWRVGHDGLTSWAYRLHLNDTSAQTEQSAIFNSTAPTSTVFSIGNNGSVNASGENHIAYCFADVKGYSKVSGSYVGNNNADGNFIHLGFKPAFFMAKNSTEAGYSWEIFDNKRNSPDGVGNIIKNRLFPDSNSSEGINSGGYIDFCSNGVKIRKAGDTNSNNTYIYMAFAESPFVTSTGIPTTAR